MGKTLGGASFIWNGISQDYCFRETINCLLDLCDQVSIVYGGDDGTDEAVVETVARHPAIKPVFLTRITKENWDSIQGRIKLSAFMNEALSRLNTDWTIALQADEVLFDRSLPVIREAINDSNYNTQSFIIARYNVWRDPLSMLNVPQESKPCSTEVVRLCCGECPCYDDGEHRVVQTVEAYNGNIQSIEMYHAGFIRDPVKFVVKARNMLVDIFNIGWDERIGEKFDYRKFPFTDADIIHVPLPLPSYLIDWLQERHPDHKLK